ncbi:hypothetical protein FNH22_07080 [Fulvivirga sp. M361]|uniref:SRPBCC family protein n=1 Tax=Fulvivirga sp. M361 TaxID=2594266 RepID=UPI00117A6357|nr:SRPBCC family protein [Fulvivirga sp. M361]TRX60797.1 hypothetical protein FNH22_07080 [Fulvivirga sp. M361]
MPKMNIDRSILIKAKPDQVYTKLNDFNHWKMWSPWLIMEPETRVTVSDDTKYYEWEGDRVGSGNMKITNEVSGTSIDFDLEFLKPWKSTAKVRFELMPEGDDTRVKWSMDSSLPFFMFWMKKMMVAFVSMDYDRGLQLLKDYVEDGEVHSKLTFKGKEAYPGCKYIAIKTTCTMDEIGPQMEKDLGKIGAYIEDKKELVAGSPFSIYHKWDMVGKKVVYTSGIPVTEIRDDLPEGMITGEIPQTEVYTLTHTGPYLHLGNAWSTLYNMERAKAFKANKKIDPFETYVNDPREVSEHELVTEVHFAVK